MNLLKSLKVLGVVFLAVILLFNVKITARANEAPEGYRFPAEFEPHKATWLAWPHLDTWGKKYRDSIESVWIEMVEHLRAGEEVHILIQDHKREERAKGLLKENGVNLDNVFFHQIKTDDVWMRDMGPYFVTDGKGCQAIMACDFNGWGDGNIPYKLDEKVGREVAKLLGLKTYETEMVIEGGAITVNGAGTLITTEYCLLNKNRNPSFTKEQATEELKRLYGVTNVIWLPGGQFPGDMTEGHIDGFCKFINKNTLVFAINWGDRVSDNILEKNLAALKKANDQDGKPFNVITVDGGDGNFYIANKVVLVPTVRKDIEYYDKMIKQLEGLFPEKKVVGIDCTELYKNGGAIHCVTQQQPLIK